VLRLLVLVDEEVAGLRPHQRREEPGARVAERLVIPRPKATPPQIRRLREILLRDTTV